MIALYRGRSWISKAIRWQTRSVYSHAAWVMADGSVIEAWQSGVRHVANLSVAHTPETVVDLFSIPNMIDHYRDHVEDWLISQLGKGYDYRGVLRFLTRRQGTNPDRWFCSELVAEACNQKWLPLLRRIKSSSVSPGCLSYSPYLLYEKTITTG